MGSIYFCLTKFCWYVPHVLWGPFPIIIPFQRECIFLSTSQIKQIIKCSFWTPWSSPFISTKALESIFCLLFITTYCSQNASMAQSPPFLEALLPRSLTLLNALAINHFLPLHYLLWLLNLSRDILPLLLQLLPISSSTIFFASLSSKSFIFFI